MREHEDYYEADFCSACYQYLVANDDRGYTAEERLLKMLPLCREVVSRFMYPRFPIYGRDTLSGFNVELAEEILVVSLNRDRDK